MNFKKIFAILLLAATMLLAVSCGDDAETTADTTAETEAPADDSGDAETNEQGSGDTEPDTEPDAVTTDVVFGDPTDEFVLPEQAKSIVGIWKLGGAEGAAAKNVEIWEFKDDGKFNMLYVDSNGKVIGTEITGQYRIKGESITVTIMGAPLTYDTFTFSESKVTLSDHGSETILEAYTGSINRG